MTIANTSIILENREILAEKFLSSGLRSSRWKRAIESPRKNLVIFLMRKFAKHKKVKCETAFGSIFFGFIPEAVTSLIWRFRVYEPETSLFMLDNVKEGDVFVDIGAHFGYFSLFASELVGVSGKVVSIEAMPTTYSMLIENVSVNKKTNICTYQFAAADKPGQVQFRDYGLVNSSLNTFVNARGILDGKSANHLPVDVEAKRMDNFFADERLPHPQFVKIDAESSEHLVLEGMAGILEGDLPPVLLIEMGGGDISEDRRARVISDTLAKYGYRLFRFSGRQLVSVDLDGRVPYFNGIFVPPHRRDIGEVVL